MSRILNASNIQTGFIVDPYAGNTGDEIITFGTTTSKEINNLAMLVDSVVVSFQQPTARKFFLNTKKSAYIRGFGNGTLTVTGLLGASDGFKKIFGSGDELSPCNDNLTATLSTASLKDCDKTKDADTCEFTLGGLVPTSLQITASVQDNGVVYYQANATFLFTSLELN